MTMRYFEIASGIRIAVSKDEQNLIDMASNGPVREDDLDAHQVELAHRLTSRDILVRDETDNATTFKLNSMDDVWRF